MKTALALLLTAPLLVQTARSQTPETEFFEKKVRPIFASNCYACHGPKMQIGGLNLSSGAGAGPETGVVVKGDPEQSRLMRALGYADKIKMPPSGKLSANDITTVKTWIEMGGSWPKDAATQTSAGTHKGFPPEVKSFWSFQPVKDVQPPQVRQPSWVKNPIDRFILAKLEEKKLTPAAPASKLTLLRRATYDLIGLPPTTKEIEDFLADKSPDAFATVVDRLLASPKYGEQWGRHWLDVARYAESTGMDEDNAYPHAWRYRDYVVKAFNQDQPYNRFVTEQLAGDLLPSDNQADREQRLIATGFLALGPKPLAQQDRVQMLYDVVDEQIDTVSKSFMGLTVACARCHDHKFDPILTKDYYSLASVFASTTSFRHQGRPGSISYMYYAPLDPAAYQRYQTQRWNMLSKQMEMEDALSEDLGYENATLRPKVGDVLTAAWKVHAKGMTLDAASSASNVESKQVEKWLKWLRAADDKARAGYLKDWFEATDATIAAVANKYQEAYTKSAAKSDSRLEGWRAKFARDALQERGLPDRPKVDAEEDPLFAAATFNGGPMELPDSQRVAILRKEFEQRQKALPEAPALASAVCEGIPVEQHVFQHGDHHNPGEPVAKQFPIILAGESQKPVEKGSGRLELAQWLTSPDHPLTARVMANRIWQGHFGEALVRTPNNWGKTGEKPTHPELLDYLAKRFIENGWSIKAMHRLILLSSTYQMSSKTSKEAREADPGNRLWSRFNRVRMSVEQIRDSLLALDGTLDPAIGGTLPASTAKEKRPKIDPDDIKRRTIYIPVRRGSIPNLLATFDFGDATTSNEGRPRTNVAPQALFMMNSSFVMERAKGFATKLLDDAGLTDAGRIEKAYLMVLTRKPDASEIDSALSYIANLEKQLGATEAHSTAWQSFCHILMSSNEFVYLN
jgi:hypothetical protein